MPYTRVNHHAIGITGSSMSEEVCSFLRQGKRCDKPNEFTSIIVTGFAPVDSWGECRPPGKHKVKQDMKLPGLCYYWDHNPQEVQEEISCWKRKFPVAQGPSVIPMVPSRFNEIIGCLFLKVHYRQPTVTGHTNIMNAGGNAQVGGSTQGGESSLARGSARQAGDRTQAGRGAQRALGMDPDFFQSIRLRMHTEATSSRYVYHHS
jgi:hypothetical protein